MGMISSILALLMVYVMPSMQPEGPTALAVGSLLVYLTISILLAESLDRARSQAKAAGLPIPPPAVPGGLLVFGIFLFVGSWRAFLVRMTGDLPFVVDLLGFLPFVLVRVGQASVLYPPPSSQPGSWSRSQQLLFFGRMSFLPVAPLILVRGLVDSLERSDSLSAWFTAYDGLLTPLTMIAALVLVFAFAPLLIRWVLGAKPLEEGALRQRLLAYGTRSGFKPTNILMWPTGNTMPNAFFVGIIPMLRYVVLTDALMSRLSDEQVEAVYAHEAGHGMRRHTQLYVLMAIGVTLLAVGLQGEALWLTDRFMPDNASPEMSEQIGMGLQVFLSFGLMALFFFGGLGWMSRRFETEADLHAIETVSDPEAFSSALEAVGLHAGLTGKKHTDMLHFGIGTRIGLINRYLHEPGFKQRYDVMIKRMRVGIIGLCAGGALMVGLQAPAHISVGNASMALHRGEAAYEAGDRAQSERHFAAALDHARSAQSYHGMTARARNLELQALASKGDRAMERGDWRETQRLLDQMKERVLPRDFVGSFNTRNLEVLLEAAQGRPDAKAAEKLAQELWNYVKNLDFAKEPSIPRTMADLYLASRAGGGEGPARGRPRKYWPPVAKLLYVLEMSPEKEVPEELVEAAAEKLKGSEYKRRLFNQAMKARQLDEHRERIGLPELP